MGIGLDSVTYSRAPKAMFFKSQKRAERRMKRNFPAQVMLGGFAKRDCKVVDISESGARIAISGAIELPHQFGIASRRLPGPANCLAKRDHGWREVPEIIKIGLLTLDP